MRKRGRATATSRRFAARKLHPRAFLCFRNQCQLSATKLVKLARPVQCDEPKWLASPNSAPLNSTPSPIRFRARFPRVIAPGRALSGSLRHSQRATFAQSIWRARLAHFQSVTTSGPRCAQRLSRAGCNCGCKLNLAADRGGRRRPVGAGATVSGLLASRRVEDNRRPARVVPANSGGGRPIGADE